MKRYAQGGVHTKISEPRCIGQTDWELDEKAGFDFFVTASRFQQCHSAIPTIGIFWSWKDVRRTLQIDDCQSFARFWEVEIQQRALLKTWKDSFISLFVANNKKWLEETSLIVEVEEETTSELDLVPRGRRDQMLTSKELWWLVVASHGHLSGFIWPKVCEGSISGVYVHAAWLISGDL